MHTCASRGLAALTIAATAGLAHAAIAFDAGIDTNANNGPNFFRNFGDTLNGGGSLTRLAVYNNEGPSDVFLFDVTFDADFTLSDYQAVSLGGGQVLHTYSLEGVARFVDDQGNDLLSLFVDNAVFTSLGTQDRFGMSSTIQGSSDAGSSLIYSWGGDAIPEIGLPTGTLGGQSTFAFGLTETNLFGDGAPGVSLDQDGYPDEFWYADAVFTGSVVPAPLTLTPLALAGGLASRRRRRA